MTPKQSYATSRWQRFIEVISGLLKALFSPGHIGDRREGVPPEDIRQAMSDLCLSFVTVVATLAIIQEKAGATLSGGSYPIAPEYEYYEARITIMMKDGGMCHLYIGESVILCVDGEDTERVLNTKMSPSALANIILVQLGWERPV